MTRRIRNFIPLFHSLLLLCAFALPAAQSQAASPPRQAPIAIVTGLKTGTYYIFGRDIAEMAKKAGIEVEPKPSEGSIDNIKRINSDENATLGIVQSDVLGFLGRSKNPDSMRMASNLRMVFPFYNEEVHVLARKDIKDFKDLEGKKVAIGEEGSGNMLTSINLFSMMNINPAETRKIPSAQGVVAVLKGEIDAAIFVGGKPVRLFKNLEDLTLPENQKYASMLENVHFIPMASPKMLEEYKPAEITPSDYSFVKEPVPTIAVQAILVTYDFSQSDNNKRCEQLGKFAKALREGLPLLKETGHPKWKEVNLDANVNIWKKDSCAWPGVAPVKSEEASKDLLNILDKK
jgi:TRAP transporter TAXI family solute receptor